MDRYRAYLLPGVAALVVLGYYAWRWSSGTDANEPAAPATVPAPASDPKAAPAPAREPPRADPAARTDARQAKTPTPALDGTTPRPPASGEE